MEGLPEVIEINKFEHDSNNFGGVWHSDTTYLERPPMGSMLYAIQVPPYGGDTLFANQYLAYEELSDTMRGFLDNLMAVNSSAKADVTRTREDMTRGASRRVAARAELRASGGAHSPRNQAACPVRELCSYQPLQKHDRSEECSPLAVFVRASGSSGIRLPIPLEPRIACFFGIIGPHSTIPSTTIMDFADRCAALR